MLKKLKALVNKAKRRLAWLLIGKALLFRLENLQGMMDLAMNEMAKVDAMEAAEDEPDRAKFEDERETWSNLYFRYYELEVEVSGFVEYLKG